MNEHDLPQQLTMLPAALPASERPLQFRLDVETRRRGLRHVAEIKRQLAQRQAAKSAVAASNVQALPVREPARSDAA